MLYSRRRNGGETILLPPTAKKRYGQSEEIETVTDVRFTSRYVVVGEDWKVTGFQYYHRNISKKKRQHLDNCQRQSLKGTARGRRLDQCSQTELSKRKITTFTINRL
ncbi:hypothetical protein QE152_g666 [Popillia japonica]|uniref:Uncharacterized protein n=1 Tax=Popillia japonica TaxID=7064 RepID=A0AAW1NLK7_POPJA